MIRVKVFDKILQQIREKLGQRLYVMTLHAEEEMENDGLSILDSALVDYARNKSI